MKKTKPTARETLDFISQIEKADDAHDEAATIVDFMAGALYAGEIETLVKAINGGSQTERLEALRFVKAAMARAPRVKRHVEGLNVAGATLGKTVGELMKGAAAKEAATLTMFRKAADGAETSRDVVQKAVALANQAVSEAQRIGRAYEVLSKAPAITAPFRTTMAAHAALSSVPPAAAAELEQLSKSTTDPATAAQLKVMAARANASR